MSNGTNVQNDIDRQIAEELRPDPERPILVVTDNILLYVFTFLFFVGTIYFTGRGSVEGAANPLLWFALIVFIPLFLGVQQGARNLDSIVAIFKAIGYNLDTPRQALLQALMGVGIGVFFFSIISRPATVLAQTQNPVASLLGQDLLASVAQPLYMPLSTGDFQISTYTLSTGLQGGAIYYVVVAFFEEGISVLAFYNVYNWLVVRFDMKTMYAGIIAILASTLMWGSAHFASWGGLTAGTLFMALILRVVFWMPFIVLDNLGLISPGEPLDWTNFSVWGGFTAHLSYNVMVHAQQTGMLAMIFFASYSFIVQGIAIGVLLAVVPVAIYAYTNI